MKLQNNETSRFMKNKTDLTNLIVNDIDNKENPTLRLFIMVIMILLMLISSFFILYSDNKEEPSLNPFPIVKNIKKESAIVKESSIVKKSASIIKNTSKKERRELFSEVNEIKPIYFIQVSVFNKNKDIDNYFLSKIKKNNFKFKVSTSGRFKKVLIGPYSGYSSAKENLPIIQDKIEKTAFITKNK